MTLEQVDEAKAVGASKTDSKAGAARGLSAVPAKAAVGASKVAELCGLIAVPAEPAVSHQSYLP